MSGLNLTSWVFLGLGGLTAFLILVDVIAHPQHMRLMNIVWPITGLYLPVIGFLFYRKMGRPMAIEKMEHAHQTHHEHQTKQQPESPSAKQVFLSSSHCGSGCVIGDVIGAPIVLATGFVVLGTTLFADYIVEFVLAYILGIAFQYFPIRSMKRLPPIQAFRDAVKADTMSLIAFQVGMFGWMAIVYYVLMAAHPPKADSPVYWFMMQIGMVLGFLTTYPANWLLIKRGIKSAM